MTVFYYTYPHIIQMQFQAYIISIGVQMPLAHITLQTHYTVLYVRVEETRRVKSSSLCRYLFMTKTAALG